MQADKQQTIATRQTWETPMRKRIVSTGLIIGGVLVATSVSGAIVGSTTNVRVIEVTRKTTATREQIWELWADVPNRTRWDSDLEYAKLDGPFRAGSMGEVKLEGQPARKFLITHCEPLQGYTDRFFLPFYAKMHWHHTIKETGGGREVTFRIEVSGPSALILAPIMRSILRDSLPPSIDKLVSLAEEA
jgi:hypothetical protein